jgi:hypothetical protein
MTPEQARLLMPIVNNKLVMDALKDYVGIRKEILRKANDIVDEVRQLSLNQGAIWELNRFETLRDEVYKAVGSDPKKPVTMTILDQKKKAS